MLWCSNKLRYVILDVLTAPWRENNIFGFSGSSKQIEGKQNTVSTTIKYFFFFFFKVEEKKIIEEELIPLLSFIKNIYWGLHYFYSVHD